MSWIEDNKGAGPWEFNKSQVEGKYNEGNRISTLGDPIWSLEDNGLGGIPITPTHYPNCGMWNGLEAPGPPPITPRPTLAAAPIMDYIEWTPGYGGTYGRFVGVNCVGVVTPKCYYSNDGGVTWTQVLLTPPFTLGHNVWFFTYCREYGASGIFIANWSTSSTNQGTATSLDGINWTKGPSVANGIPGSPYRYTDLHKVGYSVSSGLFFAGAQSDSVSHAWTSLDALNWTPSLSIIQPYNGFRGVADYDGYAWIFSYNYNYAYRSNLTLPSVWTQLTGTLSPYNYMAISTPLKGEAIVSNSILMYDQVYFNGTVWTPYTHRIGYANYNKDISVIGSVTRYNPPPLFNYVYFSMNGLDWTSHYATSNYVSDVAVGNDRAVSAISNTPQVVITYLY